MSQRFGRYEVTCKLGEGAMAAVHLARDPVLTRHVAVKVLHRNVAATQVALKRFFNEARVVANVRNPHVVEVFDFGKEGGEYFLVMEFVDGQSLQAVLKQLRPAWPGPGSRDIPGREAGAPVEPGEPLPDTLAAALLAQAAEGLEMAARHGVVHRDIKPENLMINQQGYLKIGDFGIAHLQDESLTRTGAVLGSPLYMSPEQVRGAKPITSQSDMFSLGAVLYRCLAGAPPFAAPGLKDLFRKIAAQPHRPLLDLRPDLDPGLAHLVETLLQKDPSRRGGGPRWLRGELRAYLLARGVDDPMDLVARHLVELSRRGIQTTWRLDPGAVALPRTVASTSPWSPSGTEPSTGSHPMRTLGQARSRPHPALPPTLQGEEGIMVPRRSRSGSRKALRRVLQGAAACCALALAAAGGYWFQGRAPVARSEDDILEEKIARLAEARSGLPGEPSPGFQFQGKGKGARSPSDPGAGRPGPDPVPTLLPEAAEEDPPNPGDRSNPPSGDPSLRADRSRPPAAAEDAPKSFASMVIRSAPPFAEVFLDGRYIGVTPVRLAALETGRHRLLVRGKDRSSFDTLMQVEGGSRVVMVRLGAGEIAYSEAEE